MSFRDSRGFTSWFLQVDSSELMKHTCSLPPCDFNRRDSSFDQERWDESCSLQDYPEVWIILLIPTLVLFQLFSQVVVLKIKPTQKVGIIISGEIEVITEISSIWQFSYLYHCAENGVYMFGKVPYRMCVFICRLLNRQ